MTVHVIEAAIAAFLLACDVASIAFSDWLGFTQPTQPTSQGRHRRA